MGIYSKKWNLLSKSADGQMTVQNNFHFFLVILFHPFFAATFNVGSTREVVIVEMIQSQFTVSHLNETSLKDLMLEVSADFY